ncbi:MAG: MerR family transcriptional regulator [Candidatus Babeliales bacterium]
MKRKKGYFSISAVAKMFSVHQQTIRLYEKEGLIAPKRTEGNTRLFSEEDVDMLEQVIYLTHELGINLAGVEMVLKLQKQIKKLQKEINRAFENTQEQLDKESELYKGTARQSAQKLLALKSAKSSEKFDHENKKRPHDPIDIDPWEIDYEE